MSQPKALVQISMAEAVVLLTAACLLIGMIWSPWWWLECLFFLLAIVAFLMTAIACSARGETKWFAAGFSILAIGYLGLSMAVQAGMVRVGAVYVNELPTTMVWQNGYEWIKRETFRYADNSEAISSSLEPYRDPQGYILDKKGNVLGVDTAGANKLRHVRIFIVPSVGTYSVIGELSWALLLGYLGGKFVVGFRRYQENARLP